MNELALERVDLEGRVQRAEGNGGGGQEYHAEDKQHDAERARHDTAKIKIGKQRSDDDADEAVNI